MKSNKSGKSGRGRLASCSPSSHARSVIGISRFFFAAVCAFWLVTMCVARDHKTGTLKGKIVDEKGKPVVGCTVKLTDTRDRSVKEVETDATGNFSIELPPDEYLVSFQSEGFQEASLQALQQVEEGKETHVKTITLPKATHTSLVRGSVFNLTGQTISGVRVTITRIPTDEEQKEGKKVKSKTKDYTTNAHGEFAFRLPAQAARYRVTASARGFKSDVKVVDVNGSEAVPVALTLLPQKSKG